MKLFLFCLTSFMIFARPVQAESLPSSKSIGMVNSCSASLVILPGIKKENHKALVATNGHCLLLNLYYGRQRAYPLPGEVLTNITDAEFLNQTSIKLHADQGTILVHANRLLFATMTGTDLALFELKETYQELRQQYQLEPFVIATKAPRASEKILIFSGYYQRQFQCAVAGKVNLIEGPFYTNDAIQLTKKCDIYPGVSGSPIVSQKTGEVLGLANTHSSGEGRLCEFNNPCFVNKKPPQFVSPKKGTSFGIPLHALDHCFNQDLQEFDFADPACDLVSKAPTQIFKAIFFKETDI